MERLTVCKTVSGKYAVRDIGCAGFWNTKGELAGGCSLAEFQLEQDTKDFVANMNENEPLFLEEFEKMDGEPVYLHNIVPVEYGDMDGWYLVDYEENRVFNAVRDFNLSECIGCAYRHKIGEED